MERCAGRFFFCFSQVFFFKGLSLVFLDFLGFFPSLFFERLNFGAIALKVLSKVFLGHFFWRCF